MISFDQHFLEDKQVLENITRAAHISSEDAIIEIGPGRGELTLELLKKNPKQVISLEIDHTLEPYLKKISLLHSNFTYKIQNGLESLEHYTFSKLIANIPYSITEPLYYKLVEIQVPFALLLHGETFYKKVLDPRRKLFYFITSTYNVSKILEIPGDKFNPSTKVLSALLKLTLKENRSLSEECFYVLFTKRHRKLNNALIFTLVDVFSLPKKKAQELVNDFFSQDTFLEKTPEILSNEEFLLVVEFVQNTIKKLENL